MIFDWFQGKIRVLGGDAFWLWLFIKVYEQASLMKSLKIIKNINAEEFAYEPAFVGALA